MSRKAPSSPRMCICTEASTSALLKKMKVVWIPVPLATWGRLYVF